jgi:hypothetical protein
VSRKRQPAPAPCPPCAVCADLRAKARAIVAAEARRDAADPSCPCHNYRRSFCIASAIEAWWTRERIAEYHDAKDAFDKASAEFEVAMETLRESARRAANAATT